LSSLVSAGVILAVVVFLAPLLRNLRSAALGGIVLSSILGPLNFAEFKRYYAQRKTDFVLACTALVGVAASDVMTGLMLTVFLSLVMLLYRASRPYIAIVGQRANSEFGDLGRHPDARPIPGLVILRLDAPLYFFNANVARTQILAQTATDPKPQAILLDLAASADLDIGTADMLCDLYSDLRTSQIDLLFAQIRGSVHDRMVKTGLLEHIGEDHLYASTIAAVAAFQARPAPVEALPMAG
jgi:sulfate permease, SulP family